MIAIYEIPQTQGQAQARGHCKSSDASTPGTRD